MIAWGLGLTGLRVEGLGKIATLMHTLIRFLTAQASNQDVYPSEGGVLERLNVCIAAKPALEHLLHSRTPTLNPRVLWGRGRQECKKKQTQNPEPD